MFSNVQITGHIIGLVGEEVEDSFVMAVSKKEVSHLNKFIFLGVYVHRESTASAYYILNK